MIVMFSLFILCKGAAAMNNDGVFFGLFRQGAPANINLITDFENKYGKKVSMIMWYQDYSCPFPTQDCDIVWNHGAVPQIVWEPWIWGEDESKQINLDAIISGKWDNYIKEWAKGAKDWGKPVFVRWAHEFNIIDYPWSIEKNGKDPAKYVAAWRHVIKIFRNTGATNVKWIWCYMRESWPQEDWNDYEKAYPGDEFVDWIGIDGYNWGTTQSWSKWQSMVDLFRTPARFAWKRFSSKPIMIAEFAATEKGGNKADWIKSMPAELKLMPYIKAVLWFDLKKEASWQIASSPASEKAFKEIMKNSYFITGKDNLLDALPMAVISTPKKTCIAKKTNKVTINGNLSEWSSVSSIQINSKEQVQEGLSTWKGPSDCSGDIKVMWDDNNMYIAARIVDNVPFNVFTKNADIWNADCLELVFSANQEADSERTYFEFNDLQLGISPGNGKNINPSVWIWSRNKLAEGAKVVSKRFDKGYILEASIPWKTLRNFAPASGVLTGFDAAIDDSDGKTRKTQMVWNGDFMFYKDPSVWGVIKFLSQ